MDRRMLLRASGAGVLTGLATTVAAGPARAAPSRSPSHLPVSSWIMASKLVAHGPDPAHADAMRLYGQFVGSWDVTVRELFGERLTYAAEWHFGWILHGRGVQDVFGRLAPSTDNGTTIRIYDPTVDRWVVSWFGPLDRSVRHFQAQRVGDEIVQTGAEFEGSPMRWIFHDIEENHFLWRNEISFSEGTWTVVVRMEATRRRRT